VTDQPDPAHAVDPAYLAVLHQRWLVDEPDRRWRDDPGTLVFFDISGFTPLTERLASRGKIGGEELTDILNLVFGELLAEAERYGGDTLKFGGDAVLLHFDGPEHELRACAAAWAMQQVMRSKRRLKTSVGTVSLGASCGIASGPVHAFLGGDEFRELLVAGPTTTAALTMEAAAHAGEILVADSTAAAIDHALLGGPGEGGGRPLLASPSVSERPLERPAAMPETAAIQPLLAPYLAHGAEGEHRQAVVAFLQYRGLDALLEQAGPEGVAIALDELMGTIQQACAHHGITFVGTDCDRGAGKVMLATGAPTGDTLDADRMLLGLREVLAIPQRLTIRAGVNRGRTFSLHLGAAHRRAWTTMGETTNLAARVMGRSPDGDLLATSAVIDQISAPFALRNVEPFMVKGVAAAVQASLVGAVDDRASSGQHRSTDHRTAPFVGRTAELDELEQLVRAASGAVVELRGEPGIGKSRLLEELAERTLAMGRRVVLVEGRPYGTDSAYGAVRPPLRELIVGDEDPTDHDVALALREHLDEPARRWTSLVGIPFGLELPPTAEQLALTPAAARMRLRLELLPVLGEIVPDGALLIVEDAQWLDEASASLLAAAVSAPVGRELTTIVATRQPVPDFDPVGMRTMELGPLDDVAVDALLSLDDGVHTPLPPAVTSVIAARAHGHPLFLAELVAAARAGRDVEALPDTIEAVLVAHVDRLAPADRAVLRQAAVLGMGFGQELLGVLVGSQGAELEATLERLDDFLMREPNGHWTFRQALAREAAYEALPFRVRRRLHAQAAELLERASGNEVGPTSPILSLHAAAADDHPRSWRFSRIAAERAERQGAPIEAAVFLRRALHAGQHMADLTPRAVAEVAQQLGDVSELAGLYEQADAAYREARRLVAGDPIRTAELCRKRGWLRERTGSYSQALRWYTQGLTVLGEVGGLTAGRLRGRLTLAYGAARLRQGKLVDSIEPLLQAAEMAARTDDQPSLAHASYLLDWAHTDLGRPVEAYREQALRIYEDLGDWTGQANVLNNLGVDAYFAGDWLGAIDLYERSRRARERGGDVVRFGEALVNIGELMVDQGRIDEAEPRLRRALGLWRGAGFPVGVGVALMNLGRAAARRADDLVAEEYLERARETLEAIGSEQTIDVAVREGERLVLRRRGADALPGLEAARAEALRRGGAPVLLAQLDRFRAGALAQTGDFRGALALLDDALAAAHDTPYEAALAVDTRARLAQVCGEPVDQQAWDDALTELRRLGVIRIWPPPVDDEAPDDGIEVPR
jgi:class 3 adenylate cyclase/tetratricopeptide (TPR) repeat protein